MTNIIVGFSRPKGHMFPIFSWLIRLFEWTSYSHVYLKWYSAKYDKWVIYQAANVMVHFMGNDIFEEHAEVLHEYELEISKQTKHDLVAWCLDHAGIDYGISGVLGYAVQKINGWFGVKVDNPFADGRKKQFCSELVANVLDEVLGYDILSDKQAESFGVKDIHRLVKGMTDGSNPAARVVERQRHS